MFPPGNTHYILAFKNPRHRLGMKNLLLQAFPTCGLDMMDAYQKVAKWRIGYTVLDLHLISDDRKCLTERMSDHWPKWYTKHQFKVPMTSQTICAYLKGLSKYRRTSFFVLKYVFQRYWRFSIMQIRSVAMSYCWQLKSGEILNKGYLWKYWSSVLET